MLDRYRCLSILRTGLLFLAAAVFNVELSAEGLPQPDGLCTNRFRLPPRPRTGTSYNGLTLSDTCFHTNFSEYDRRKLGNPVFAIGDWGGINYGNGPVPADHTKTSDIHKRRNINPAVDFSAQEQVAGQFNYRGSMRNPDYVINVGDNFYWGGISCPCGTTVAQGCGDAQWKWIYEAIYKGKGIDGVQWLGVLGNHDYGGWRFDKGWDQVIGYSWGGPSSTGRWVQPAVYYKARVRYDDFAIDYFFLDTNLFDVRKSPWWDPEHNLCGGAHNAENANCGEEGPANRWACAAWFGDMWAKQQSWLDKQLKKSITDGVEWQAIVTHFPPWWGKDQWLWIFNEYGVDLFITGHVHRQDVLNQYRWDNSFKPTVVVVTGGGGGITSELWPDAGGNDDQYGFMDLTLWKDKIKVEALSHTGVMRSTTWFGPRQAAWKPPITTTGVPGFDNTGEAAAGYGYGGAASPDSGEQAPSDSSFVSDIMDQRQEPDVAPTGIPDRESVSQEGNEYKVQTPALVEPTAITTDSVQNSASDKTDSAFSWPWR